jgi:alkylhydroperoxidase family enzyme
METMDDRRGRYAAYTARLVEAVLTQPGHTPPELRRAIVARAGGLASSPLSGTERGTGGEDPLSKRETGALDLASYVDKVAKHAYTVTDDDLRRLQQAGHSDDALFEVTVSAALGAALGRLERGLAALRSSPPDPRSPDVERGN